MKFYSGVDSLSLFSTEKSNRAQPIKIIVKWMRIIRAKCIYFSYCNKLKNKNKKIKFSQIDVKTEKVASLVIKIFQAENIIHFAFFVSFIFWFLIVHFKLYNCIKFVGRHFKVLESRLYIVECRRTFTWAQCFILSAILEGDDSHYWFLKVFFFPFRYIAASIVKVVLKTLNGKFASILSFITICMENNGIDIVKSRFCSQ